jgi:glycosyltransferase involved in cell wall biosynthesis
MSNQRLEKTDEFKSIIQNSYTYVASNFVNDIIYKFYNLKLDLIESISIKDDFYVKLNFENDESFSKIKYVTIINCHYNKGGYLLKYLCENLDIRIPLQIIYTEHDPNITIEYINNLINERNKKNNINIFITEKINIKLVYLKTRILLIPSLCEETFCRVAYEGMMNKIPILSTKSGNLKYLLNNYAIFINDFDIKDWKYNIENIYFDKNKIISLGNIPYSITDDIIENKIMKKIYSMTNNISNDISNNISNKNNNHKSKYLLNDKNIGIILPWADQGLGIQGRDYYITLKNIGYNPYIFSFKPYHCTHDNLLLQTDKNEWIYENIHYSKNYRENIELDEIINFIYTNNIKKVIIIEATFINIFRIAFLLKLLGVKLYLVVNIECIRLVEINYHDVFDKILTNNEESYNIMKVIYPEKTYNLGFHMNHPYFSNIKYIKDIKNNNLNRIIKGGVINFCCIGGFNSISRKNINLVIQSFYNIYRKNYNSVINKKWILNVYIQGVEIPDIINEYQCDNINYYVSNLSYKDIINKYIENDIFIHMGSHEGLGLGFYESLYCGTPLLTMNWTPNNEIIRDKLNGWLIDCEYSNVYDNDISIINQGIIKEYYLKDSILSILENTEETISIIKNVNNNIENLQKINKFEFEKRFLNILDK